MFISGWLHIFKKRHSLMFKKFCGETGAMSQAGTTDQRTEKPQALVKGYSPYDNRNCEETGLFCESRRLGGKE